MAVLADILLLIAALSAALYCRVLALRLRRLGDTGKGLGGAISALSVQADEMKATLNGLQGETDRQVARLESAGARADAAARRLELLLAALPDEVPPPPPPLKLSPADRLPAETEAGNGATTRKRGPARRIFRNRAVGGLELSA